MKRVLSLILVAVMLLGTLTSCANIMSFFGNDEGLEKAQANVKQLYINKAKVTNADFEVVPQVTIGQDVYTIEWTVNVTDGVKVEKTEDGKVWIRVNSKTEVEIPYVLTATIKSPKGKTITQTFEFSVPKFKELTWAEFAATEDDEPVVIKGVIGGIVETAKENDLYLQDENGGYFVYKLAVKPSEQGLKVGMTVRVSGIRDTYYGVYQISNPQVEILDETIKEITPTDITQVFVDAKDLKSESLTKYQSMFVTIKGALVLGQDANDLSYFNFSLAGKKAYVRISSSTSMLTEDGEETFKKNVKDNKTKAADVTGFVSIYNNNIYIIPLDENAFSNFRVEDLSPAEQIAVEKELLASKVTYTYTSAGVYDLITKPEAYNNVQISWAVAENTNGIELDANGKLIVRLPNEEIKVTLTATFTNGEVTDTASYEVTIAAAPTTIPQIVTAPEASTGYKYFLKQGNINQTLYFAGIMDGYYLATTTNPTEAVDVGLEPIAGKDGEYYLYFMDGTIKTYIVAYVGTKTDGSEVANLKLSIHQKEANVWTFNAEHNTPTTKLTIKDENGEPKEDTYYIGSYNTFQTFSLSKISYLPSKTSFAAQFATLLDVTKESNADKVAAEKDALTFDTTIKKDCEIILPMFGSTFEQVEITWASNSDFATITGDILTIKQQKEEQNITLTATISYGGVTETKEIPVTITALPTEVPQVVKTPVAGTEYYFALYQGNLNSLLFITGNMDGFYYETTDDIDAAIKVKLEAVDGKEGVYYLSTTVEGAKKYLNIVKSDDGKYNNVVYGDAAISEYVYNAEYKTVTTVLGEDTFFFGTYNNYKTFSASTIDRASTNFVAHFYELVNISDVSDADKVAQEKDALVGPNNKYTEGATVELSLAGKNFADVVISWNSNSEFAVIENGVLTITIPATETVVTITATLTCGEAIETVTFEVTLVKPADPDQPLTYEDYMAAQDGEALSKLVNVVVTGIVSKSAGSSYNCLFVQDANGGAYYIYGMTQDPIADLKIEIGMTVSIEGGVKAIHYGTHEIKPSENGMTVTVVSSEKTPVAPVDYTEIFKNATDMKDEALVGKQALLVTIKGVVIGGQNTGSGYLYFKIGDKEAYLRISSSTLGFNTADKDAFIAAHAAKKGYSADVTGIISQYNGAFYLVPVSTDAFVYGELVEQPEETTPAPETPDEPAADSTLTIVDAVTLGDSMAHNTTTTGKYYVTGVVQEIKHTTYGNMYIVDENGNSIYVYGTYSADGSARYDAMDVKPVAGDTVTLYGVVGNYNGAQIKNAWIVAHEAAAPSVPEETTPEDPEVTTPAPDTPAEPAPEAGTVTGVIKDIAAANGWVDGNNSGRYDSFSLNEYISVSVTATATGNYGINSGKPYGSPIDNWRIYQNESPAIIIAATEGKNIVSVKVTYTVSNTGILTLDGNNVESAALVEVNANSITFSVGNTGTKTNGQVRITAIEVVYA